MSHHVKRRRPLTEPGFEFKDFVEAFIFMTGVVFLAGKMDHLLISVMCTIRQLSILLFTHAANNDITEKDLNLSKQLHRIYKK